MVLGFVTEVAGPLIKMLNGWGADSLYMLARHMIAIQYNKGKHIVVMPQNGSYA